MKPFELLSTRQVLEALQVSPKTLRKWVRMGKFPAPALILGRHRWKADDITAYYNRQFRVARKGAIDSTADSGA